MAATALTLTFLKWRSPPERAQGFSARSAAERARSGRKSLSEAEVAAAEGAEEEEEDEEEEEEDEEEEEEEDEAIAEFRQTILYRLTLWGCIPKREREGRDSALCAGFDSKQSVHLTVIT